MAGKDPKACGLTVQAAQTEDIDAIVALERATEFAPHWPREVYTRMVGTTEPATEQRHLHRRLMVAKGDDGHILGFAAGYFYAVLPDSAVLESVGVAAAKRRAGLGKALCEAVFAWCRSEGAVEIGLEVRRSSAGAIALYSGLGFAEVGMRPGYYADSTDALVMRKDLAVS